MNQYIHQLFLSKLSPKIVKLWISNALSNQSVALMREKLLKYKQTFSPIIQRIMYLLTDKILTVNFDKK